MNKNDGNTLTSFRLAELLSSDYKVVYVAQRSTLNNLPYGIVIDSTSSFIKNFDKTNLICVTNTILYSSVTKFSDKIHNTFCIFIYDDCNWACTTNKHTIIKEFFNDSLFYGFTSQPLFEENAKYGKTSNEVFQKQLYSYKLIDSLRDGTSVPFEVDYVNVENNLKVKQIVNVVYSNKNQGYNQILIVKNLLDIPKFYEYFKKHTTWTIATLFSPTSSSELINGKSLKYYFEDYLLEYNLKFKTTFDSSSGSRKKFKQHILNNKNVDLLIIAYSSYLDEMDCSLIDTIYLDDSKKDILPLVSNLTNRFDGLHRVVCFNGSKYGVDNKICLLNKKHDEKSRPVKNYLEYVKEFNDYIDDLFILAPSFEKFSSCTVTDEIAIIMRIINEAFAVLNILKTFKEFTFDDLNIDLDTFNNYKMISNDFEEEFNKSDAKSNFELVRSNLIDYNYILNLINHEFLDKYNICPKCKSQKLYSSDDLTCDDCGEKLYNFKKYISENTNFKYSKFCLMCETLFEEIYGHCPVCGNELTDISEESTFEKNELIIPADELPKIEPVSTPVSEPVSTPVSEAVEYSPWSYSKWDTVFDDAAEAFPFSKPREYQLETISEIQAAIDKGYKYIILEAGTGTGKSAIAATVARMHENSFILTVTKQLQEQYLKDFKEFNFKCVKGRQNFNCLVESDFNCDEGSCLEKDFNCSYGISKSAKKGVAEAFDGLYWKSNTHCNYYQQKIDALNCQNVVTNYYYALLELNKVGDFKKRDILILDEAHNLESILMSYLTLEFSRKGLKNHAQINLSKQLVNQLKDKGYKEWINFALRVLDKYKSKRDKLLRTIKNSGKNKKKDLQLVVNSLDKIIHEIEFFITQINKHPNEWIIDYNSYSATISFKPIKVDNYAKELLFEYGDVCLFMSATILNYKKFAQWLGINEDEVYPIRRKTPFDISMHPIYIDKSVDMSFTKLKYNAPRSIPFIKEFLNKHENEKGLVHSVSYKCADFIMKKSNNSRLLTHNSKNREEVLEKFRKSENSNVLVSPSMNEGVDLPYDDCRFQIIYKIPYPNISDAQIKARKNIDDYWYLYKTALTLLQTYGRGMRAEDDYCTTYIIDNRVKRFVSQNKKNGLIPDYFIEAIK